MQLWTGTATGKGDWQWPRKWKGLGERRPNISNAKSMPRLLNLCITQRTSFGNCFSRWLTFAHADFNENEVPEKLLPRVRKGMSTWYLAGWQRLTLPALQPGQTQASADAEDMQLWLAQPQTRVNKPCRETGLGLHILTKQLNGFRSRAGFCPVGLKHGQNKLMSACKIPHTPTFTQLWLSPKRLKKRRNPT